MNFACSQFSHNILSYPYLEAVNWVWLHSQYFPRDYFTDAGSLVLFADCSCLLVNEIPLPCFSSFSQHCQLRKCNMRYECLYFWASVIFITAEFSWKILFGKHLKKVEIAQDRFYIEGYLSTFISFIFDNLHETRVYIVASIIIWNFDK